MDISLQPRKIPGFQLVQFSSLLLRVQMMFNFEFYYFYLVLVELFRQGIEYSICWCSYSWHSSSHGIVLLRFMSFYYTIQSRWYWIWYIWKYYLSLNFFSLLSRNNIFWIFLMNFNVGSFSAIFVLTSCSSIYFWHSIFLDNTTNPEPLSNG